MKKLLLVGQFTDHFRKINKSLTEKYEVRKKDAVISLTFREFELLKFLAVEPDQIFSREVLLENVWGYEYYGDVRTVDVHITKLRERFALNNDFEIQTVRGLGYKAVIK